MAVILYRPVSGIKKNWRPLLTIYSTPSIVVPAYVSLHWSDVGPKRPVWPQSVSFQIFELFFWVGFSGSTSKNNSLKVKILKFLTLRKIFKLMLGNLRQPKRSSVDADHQKEAHSINLKTHLKKVCWEVWAISVCILINKGRGFKT